MQSNSSTGEFSIMSTSTFRIIKASDRHQKAISTLHKQTFISIGENLKSATEFLKDKRYTVFVAILPRTEKVVGYAAVFKRWNTLQFCWLAVNPALRRNGIGKMLLRNVARLAKGHGVKNIEIVTRNRFKPALITYLNEGYEIFGVEIGTDRDLLIKLRLKVV